MMIKYLMFLLLLFCGSAHAIGSLIVMTVMEVSMATYAASYAMVATAFAINMVASAIISKAFFSPSQPSGEVAGVSPNPGNNQQVAPATDNKLPIVYGSAYVGGIVTDLTITLDNQNLYYVLSICEVTNYGADTITFGDIYYGGKKVIFNTTYAYQVDGLLDESTGLTEPINGNINIYLYSNGSNTPVNSSVNAIALLQTNGLIYTWDNTKLMSNCAFAILQLTFNPTDNVTALQQTKFQVTNSRYKPGDCFYDYFTNTVYGGAIPIANIDTASLTALNNYCDELFTYTTFSSGTAVQTRFRFDGILDTNAAIMSNIQVMANCCDCLVKYNEILGLWGVIVQKPTYTVVMDINDSNMISGITVSPIDVAGSYNVIECKFPDESAQDAFNTTTFDLAQIAPALLFNNEPVNKLSLSIPLVNDSVRAQYLANRFLKSSREDLQVTVTIDFRGIQLEAGDVVSMTNTNYGWVAKLFRINKVNEIFADTGTVTASIVLSEYNPTIYDDTNITQFTPAPNTGLGDPTFFGTITAPSITSSFPTAINPYFNLTVISSTAGIVQYAEIWYSAFSNPTSDQLIFVGTTAIQSSGNPYNNYVALPPVKISISAGDWYFFSRMVNSFGTSQYSPPSVVFHWRPETFQYVDRYIVVAYADSITGTGFNLSPRGKSYYGILNSTSATVSNVPSAYNWYLAYPTFSTGNYLLFTNRGNRSITYSVGNAAYNGANGAFLPTDTANFDPTIWNGLEDGNNAIDLDSRSGQLTKQGTSSSNTADGLLSINNNTNGTMVVSLQKFLNFGNGVYSKAINPTTLTIDVYGRVVGYVQEDNFYFTETVFVASASQTTFSVTHIVGQVIVFRNGLLCDLTEYTETTTTIVLNNACASGETIIVLNMRVVSAADYYEPLEIEVASSTGSTVTYADLPYQTINAGDLLSFSNTGTPTTFTVVSVNYTTKIITFTGTVSGATVGNTIYRFRAAGASYPPFSRFSASLVGANSYSPSTYYINNGYEQIYVNGSQFNEVDYDLSVDTLSAFPAPITGNMNIILFSANNLGIPCSNITNTVAYSVNGALTYNFNSNPLAMEVYANGALLAKGYDYTATGINYNLATAFPNNYTLLNQQTFARIGAA